MAFLKCFLLFAIAKMALCESKLRLVKEWKEMDYAFPDEITKQNAVNKGFFVKGSGVPIDVDVHYGANGKTRIFVTIPRFSLGRPFTLGTIDTKGNNSDALKPYPDYSWHDNQGTNCDGITSVFRVAIDECSRIWILDTGKLGDDQVCPVQLLVFDLNTDQLLHRHRVNPIALREISLLVTPIVDVKDPNKGCKNTFVYMADITTFTIIVYDHAKDKSWRTDNKLYFPHPPAGTFDVGGETFDLMDGVLGMTLSPLNNYERHRILYFHSLASFNENYVPTYVLQNATMWENGATPDPRLFKTFKNRRQSQTAAQAMDKKGIMYFGLVTPTSIVCWNSATKFHRANMDVIAYNPLTLQFATGVKIVDNIKGEQELWILTCRFQKVMTGTYSPNEINFRIMAGKVSSLIQGTKCALPNGRIGDELNPVDSPNSECDS